VLGAYIKWPYLNRPQPDITLAMDTYHGYIYALTASSPDLVYADRAPGVVNPVVIIIGSATVSFKRMISRLKRGKRLGEVVHLLSLPLPSEAAVRYGMSLIRDGLSENRLCVGSYRGSTRFRKYMNYYAADGDTLDGLYGYAHRIGGDYGCRPELSPEIDEDPLDYMSELLGSATVLEKTDSLRPEVLDVLTNFDPTSYVSGDFARTVLQKYYTE